MNASRTIDLDSIGFARTSAEVVEAALRALEVEEQVDHAPTFSENLALWIGGRPELRKRQALDVYVRVMTRDSGLAISSSSTRSLLPDDIAGLNHQDDWCERELTFWARTGERHNQFMDDLIIAAEDAIQNMLPGDLSDVERSEWALGLAASLRD